MEYLLPIISVYYTLKSGIYAVERKINVTVEYGTKYVQPS